MSEIKVNKISPRSGTTLTLGDSGDDFVIPAGATLTNNGTASGFASIAWQSVQTTGFTAVAGNGYFCNTTSAGFTVTLPATPSAGDQIQLVDYAGTFDTNALILDPNGNKIQGGTDNLNLEGERSGVTLTYIDSTQGWLPTSGINEGTDAVTPIPVNIEYLVVAGGASGGKGNGGAGGAGGYLTNFGGSTIQLQAGEVYTVTVGAGGAGQATRPARGNNGSNSELSGTGITTITAIGGGGGGASPSAGLSGGSGGGGGGYAGAPYTGGSGTVGQGNAGGVSSGPPNYSNGGGGGAGAVGGNGVNSPAVGGNGGVGLSNSITGSGVYYAGGGGGSVLTGTFGTGGLGGGGDGEGSSGSPTATSGTANTGGGGGGSDSNTSGAGGSGVVILRLQASQYTGTTTGSPTVTDDGSYKVLKYTASGSYTA